MPASATRSMVSSASSAGCMASEQQWPATILPGKPVRIAASAMWRSERAGGIGGLVDVEIEVEAGVGGHPHHLVEGAVEVRDHEGDRAEHAVRPRHEGDELGGEGIVEEEVDREQRDRLQVDAVRPRRAHLDEDRPGDGVLRRQRIEVGAEQRRAVCVGAAEAEIHAAGDVVRRPVASRGRPRPRRAPRRRCRRDWACAARCGPCRCGCACRRRSARPCPRRGRDAGRSVSLPGRGDPLDVAVVDDDVGAQPARRRRAARAARRGARPARWRWRGRSAMPRGSRRSRSVTLSSPAGRRSRATSGEGDARRGWSRRR